MRLRGNGPHSIRALAGEDIIFSRKRCEAIVASQDARIAHVGKIVPKAGMSNCNKMRSQ
jgi:hypothetical protein